MLFKKSQTQILSDIKSVSKVIDTSTWFPSNNTVFMNESKKWGGNSMSNETTPSYFSD
jgi:hypothetical protein